MSPCVVRASTTVLDRGSAVAQLHIILQDGFPNDSVIVAINGEEIAPSVKMPNSILLGYTSTYHKEVKAGKIIVEIIVPVLGLAYNSNFMVVNEVNLIFSIIDGTIQLVTSDNPEYRGKEGYL